MNDQAFMAQLKAEPDAVLGEFDLTGEEIAAIKIGGQDQLRNLGLDERLSK